MREAMDIEIYLNTSQPAGDQRGTDDNIAVTDLLNCLSRAVVDATAAYTEGTRLETKLGDVLWYVAAIARRRKIRLKDVAKQKLSDGEPSTFDHYMEHADADAHGESERAIHVALNELIRAAADTTSAFLEYPESNERLLEKLGVIFWNITAIARRLKLSLSSIAQENLDRTKTLFGASSSAPDFWDNELDADEQLPRRISLRFSESVRNNLATVRMAVKTEDGLWLPIGNPLNDNSHVEDDYRFHDVLHLAYVAVLGWSPVMRALLGVKRKSSIVFDRVEDGARAILLEEALTGIIYEAASDNALFKNSTKLERRLLLTVKRLTRNLEVSARTYDQWTAAILAGYSVFREITESARSRTHTYEKAIHIGLVYVDMHKKIIRFESSGSE
jgi:hypothetical protein